MARKIKKIETVEAQNLVLYLYFPLWKRDNPKEPQTPLRCLEMLAKHCFGEDRKF